MSTSDLVRIGKRDGLAIITLNSQDGMNILDVEMLHRLGDALAGIENDGEVRAVIITGEKNFSAGADIKQMKDMTPVEASAFAKLGHGVCNRIEKMGKAVIAAIRGYAIGGGCELALACDIRIVSDKAKLGQPEINLGIVPGFGGTQRLARLVGVGKAKELILSGRVIDAGEAEFIGLVNHVVKDEELMRRAEEMAKIVAQKSPLAIKAAKKLINESHDLHEGLERETESFSECFTTQDHVEGMNAFVEKRAPKFRGV